MKTVRGVRVALPAAMAVLALAVASPAVATSNVVLTELKAGQKTTVADGSFAEVGFFITSGVDCGIVSYGTVVTNQAPKDVLSGTTSGQAECPAPEKISGVITESVLTYKGALTMKGSITVALSESCSYVFKTAKGTFGFGGWLYGEGTTTGKLAKGSSPSCAAEVTEDFVMAADGEESHFEAALG